MHLFHEYLLMSLNVCTGLMSDRRLFFYFAPIHILLALHLCVKVSVIDKAGRNPICGNLWKQNSVGQTSHCL